jgi:diphthamide biosynthesis methyltransferase
MLHLVGLGLADETDITVRGLEIVKKAERVYLEAYTSILLVDKAKLVSVLDLVVQLPISNVQWPVGSVLWPPGD